MGCYTPHQPACQGPSRDTRLVQRHTDVWTGGAGNRTAELSFSGRAALPPEPQLYELWLLQSELGVLVALGPVELLETTFGFSETELVMRPSGERSRRW